MSDIRVDPEFAALIPPLTAEELAQLEQNVLRDGILETIKVWRGEDVILDGHNRFALAQKHDLMYHVKYMDFQTRDEAKLWVLDNQRGRRNLTPDQGAVLGIKKEAILAAMQKRERAKAGRAQGGDATPEQQAKRLEVNVTSKRSNERSRKQAAREYQTTEHKLRQAKKVEEAAPELNKKVLKGEMPLAAAVREIKRAEAKLKLAEVAAREIEAPTGEYDVIVCDPPWPIEKIERDVRPNQSELDYPTMDEQQLAALKIPCAADCHVWLWTTNKFLPMAFRLLDAWGLKYICVFVWHKPGGFQPIGLPQYNCEFALYARRGAPTFLDTKKFNTCFEAQRGKHSEKPEAFYDTLRRVTGGRRLDMFSRRKIEGFTGWGNEA